VPILSRASSGNSPDAAIKIYRKQIVDLLISKVVARRNTPFPRLTAWGRGNINWTDNERMGEYRSNKKEEGVDE
jgi:hypothetical protein